MPLATYPAEFFKTSASSRRMGYCFVLMPFEPAMKEVFDTIREALEGEPWNFQCKRADDFFAGGHILTDVLRGIQEAQIVVADLTGRNPNVFYELGISHMVKQPNEIVLLTQDIGAIPFDLQSFRCIHYMQTIQGARKLKEDLTSTLSEVAQRVYRFAAKPRETFQFSNRLFGEENCLYDFDICADYLGEDAAKFMLRVRRFAAGVAAPETVYESGHGMKKGGYVKVPKIPWELRLDRVAGDSGQFSVVPSADANTAASDQNRNGSNNVGNMTAAQLEAIIVGAMSLSAAKAKQEQAVVLEADGQAAKSMAAGIAEGVMESQAVRTRGREWRHQMLWVDDRPDNNIGERRAFESLGVTFTLALSTNEALQCLAQNRFGAVISDMGRKEGTREGYVLLDALRERGDDTPYFIYAGSNWERHQREAELHKAQGCTNNAQELFDMVRQVLRQNS